MTEENRSQDKSETKEPQADSTNVRERVAALHEKVSGLHQTLDDVQETLRSASDD